MPERFIGVILKPFIALWALTLTHHNSNYDNNDYDDNNILKTHFYSSTIAQECFLIFFLKMIKHFLLIYNHLSIVFLILYFMNYDFHLFLCNYTSHMLQLLCGNINVLVHLLHLLLLVFRIYVYIYSNKIMLEI